VDEYQKTAHSLAAEVPKQLITLSTAIVALGATFAKDVFGAGASRTLLYWSSGLYIVSVLFGVATLQCLAGGLERCKDGEDRGSIYKGNIQLFQGIQVIVFAIATGLFVWYGSVAGAANVVPAQAPPNPPGSALTQTQPPAQAVNIDGEVRIHTGSKTKIVIETAK
jgi:hypothetical protein